MLRRAPLKRTAMKRHRRRKRPDLDDAKYLAFIRRQPCSACGHAPPSDPHHRPGAGMGARSHDHEAIPMCRMCHDDVDRFAGMFTEWTREQRQEWHSHMVAILRDAYAKGWAA
jgi:hypothetical protein